MSVCSVHACVCMQAMSDGGQESEKGGCVSVHMCGWPYVCVCVRICMCAHMHKKICLQISQTLLCKLQNTC